MSVLIFENTEKMRLTIKNLSLLTHPDAYIMDHWTTNHVARCHRCERIFFSRTDRKYCSKECQYNKYKK